MEANKTRMLPINSAYNVRDLGGYIGADGKSVKWRKLIRSGDFPHLSNIDKNYFEQLPLRTVVDFRAHDEAEKEKDFMPLSVREIYHLRVENGNLIPAFQQIAEDKNMPADVAINKAVTLMRGLYIGLVSDYIDIFRKFFNIIQNQDNVPILFHCSAGKDRTGIASALLLSALGVDRKEIFDDYMLTNKALIGKYDYLDSFGPITIFFKTVRSEFLEASFEYIETKYGSVNKYLTNELNVNIQHIRNLYLDI